MNTSTVQVIGPLYHGTREAAARIILRDGFRRSRSRSYTGTGICLSESLTVAYEYGIYETGGCVLEAWLSPATHWTDRVDGRSAQGDAWDAHFVSSGMDAVRSFAGNVWVVWTPNVLVSISAPAQPSGSYQEPVRRVRCGWAGLWLQQRHLRLREHLVEAGCL